MSQNELNMSYLRSQAGREPGGEFLASRLSRRELLKAGGSLVLAVAGAGSALPSVGQAWLGPVEVVRDGLRVALKVGGVERWAIDPSRFGGRPRVSVTAENAVIHFALMGATYPGTTLSADLTGELRPVRGVWRLQLALGLGGFVADMALADWLSGSQPARSRVRLAPPATPLGTTGALRLAGSAEATFTPDWQFKLTGPGVAHLTTPDLEAYADTATLTLVPQEAASLMQHPASRRSLITLQRHGRTWDAWDGLKAIDGGRLVTEGNPFDQIRIEAQETQNGAWRQALVAEGAAGDGVCAGSLAYLLGEDMLHPDGLPAQLTLQNPRFAVAFDTEHRTQSAVVGRFSQTPVWVCTRGFSLQLGDAAGIRPFELVAREGTTVRRNVAPAVLSLAAAMPGAIVEPIRTAGGGVIDVVSVDGMPVDGGPNLAGATVGPSLAGTTIAPNPAAPTNGSGDATIDPNPGGATIGPSPAGPDPELNIILPPFAMRVPAASVSVVRPVDMLNLEIRFFNLTLTARADAPPLLERMVTKRDAYLVYRFPPQHIAERAYHDSNDTPAFPPIPSRAAGPSWLAFKLPPGVNSLDYTLESLLNWESLVPVNIATRHDPSNNDTSASPVSAIEAPYRMFLSPSPDTYWTHKIDPITFNNRTELWHTRLAHWPKGISVSGVITYPYTSVRAIWSPDYPAAPSAGGSSPFRYAMDGRQRYEIVAQSPVPASGPAQPPIRVENLMLTALGAWMKIDGKWNPGPGLNVIAWQHEATFGRDQYVKIVERGYLYPFGHLAVKITETQRRIEPIRDTTRKAAYLRLREYILVVERERVYPGPEGVADPERIKRNRNNPLRKVTMLTRTTPNLDDTLNKSYWVPKLRKELEGLGYWPRVNGDYFPFHMIGEDWEGQRIEFVAPVVFVMNQMATVPDATVQMGFVRDEYAKVDARRTANMRGQRIAYTPRVPVPNLQPGETASDTVFETDSLLFTSTPTAAAEGAMPPFLPLMDKAYVNVPALTHMTGTSEPQSIKMDDAWLKNGFGAANPGMVFAQFDQKPGVAFGGEKSGAVMAPNMDLAGLSRSHGLVGGDTGAFAGGKFDPKTFFGDKARILGGMALSSIIDPVDDVTAGAGVDKAKVPRITSRLTYPGDDHTQPPNAIETDLVWAPQLASAGPFLNYFNPDPDKNKWGLPGTLPASLAVTANTHVPLLAGGVKQAHVNGDLQNFSVDLFNCIQLGFSHLTFTADSGQSPRTDVGLKWVKFEGPLSFVEEMRNVLGNIFGSGFKLDVEPTGVRASYSVALPNLSLGVFALTNLAISAGLELPFTDKPALVNFSFCTRENPFNLSVSAFGGGGFFGITVGMSGVEVLEAALEFGASISIDLGVASGGVSVKAGIYFKYSTSDHSTLEGYLKIHGELTVLAIASISITLYLSFTYKHPDKCWGQATITVEVEVLFFSGSAEVHAERQFSGKEGDPPFSQMITAPQWHDYTEAFA